MEPSDSGVLPPLRDTSNQDDYANLELLPRWVSVDPVSDATGNWLFALATYRLQIWNIANPDSPSKVADLGLSSTGLQSHVTGHTPQVFSQVRAAPGNSNLVAVGAGDAVGTAFFRTAIKSDPALVYQDVGHNVNRIYTARIGGADYAFAAGDLGGVGARVYNMNAASNLGSPCYQTTAGQCPGVRVGTLGSFQRANAVDGVGKFVIIGTSTGFAPGGFLIYDVSNPAAPVQVMSALAGTPIYAVAMWQEGGSYFAAVRLNTEGRIYDVSCISNGSCGTASPIWSNSMTSGTNARVSFSRANSTPMLYWSRALGCNNGTTGEFLLDVTSPASPHSMISSAYFRHYYWDTPTGFNYFAPTEGRFLGNHFYRAAWSVLDVHRRTNAGPPGPPTVGSVTASPNPANVCQDVTFTANNVTNGAGATYSWEVRTTGGTPVTGLSGVGLNPFVWDTTGFATQQYVGRVVVENTGGSSLPAVSAPVSLVGLVPLPSNFTPTLVQNNSGAVKYNVDAAGATEWSWDFGDSGGVFGPWSSDPINGPSPTHVYTAVGTYNVRVRVRNCAEGPVTSATLSNVSVPVVNPLVANFSFVTCLFQTPGPTCQVNTGLNFSDSSSGAQFWDYDWDCRSNGSGCNSFEDANHTTPVTNHVYTSSGTYTPQLRVRRGTSEQHVFTHGSITIQGTTAVCGNLVCESGESSSSCPADCGAPPPPPPSGPSLTISGPTSGQINTSYNYTATAANCTPAANGWTWNHTGSGNSSTNSITINWATAGTKGITVQNSSCGAALDNHTVSISSGTGQLVAAFTYTVNGLTVSFNATSSQGSPTAYHWQFGDGTDGTGVTTQHTYAQAGQYLVALSVTRQDPACTFGLCNSEVNATVSVGGGGPPPPPPPPSDTGLCVPDADTFCALNGDFKVEVDWTKKNGETGPGRIVANATSGNTGIFYFFDDSNWELLLKVLDACTVNDHFWVFGGAATNVEYTIRVTDMVTEEVWTHTNPQGHGADAITDIMAFPTCNVDRSLMRSLAAQELASAGDVDPRINPFDPGSNPPPPPSPPPPPPPPANVGPCDPDATTLCAIAERFRVRVNWENRKGETGSGSVAPMVTDNTGVFWFFQQDNWELLIKVLNGCGVNGKYWVFGAGATDVRYVVTVEDLQTGADWQYENVLGQPSPAITDTSAFDTCP